MYRTDITSERNCTRQTLQVRGMYRTDITSERNVQGQTLHVRGMYKDGHYM